MAELTPQQMGRAWEPEFARSVGGVLVPRSGAGFAKLDVRGNTLLWSLKWSGNNKSFRVTDDMMREAIAAIYGPGGIGGNAVPGIAFKTEGFEYVAFRKDDALMLMVEENVGIVTSEAYDVRPKRLPDFLRGSE